VEAEVNVGFLLVEAPLRLEFPGVEAAELWVPGISRMVVIPPLAEALVPELESSGGREVWVCPSSTPGRITFPPASIVLSASGRFGVFATATMTSPVYRDAPIQDARR